MGVDWASQILPADIAILVAALLMALLGIFKGFSGTLALIAGTISAGAVSTFGWAKSAQYLASMPLRVVAILIVSLLVFGIVRIIVKKTVNGLLAQPADSIFGFIVGIATIALLVATWAKSGLYIERSKIASEVALHVK